MDVDETANNTPMRVEELWFADSGFVVQAGQSLFRVSGAVLAARSSVFKDMLAFTQPPDAETIDDCPVVKLLDSAEDVTCFFRAIFDSSFFEPYPSKVTFDNALSIARLSHKYSVDYLLRRALVHLSYDFPTTLSSFDADTTYSTNMIDMLDDNVYIPPYIALVQLARQVNALWMLPMAFYRLASANKEVIRQVWDCQMFSHHTARLGDDDRLVFVTCSALFAGLETKAMRFLHPTDESATCKGGDKCNAARLSAIAEAQDSIAKAEGPDPLYICFSSLIWDALSKRCCTHCYKCLKSAHEQARQLIWDELPTICGLPPWADLEKMKVEAVKV
ncbi:BTB domain-containing protein [Mycena sanguinolenta]|uniref:BTB domain-containing protein n=1 Tax=Mycena sanguinolenta TaxID=230812 RepID=A0A8H6YDD7_9AGAR|nr:BTB domain-containing protein [Mycena sanguinolenta]